MIYRTFGKTGLQVSAIGMGCEYVWTASEEKVCEVVGAAVAAGINYFDLFVGTPSTREYYGKALKDVRDKVYLAGHLGCADVDGQYVKTRDENLSREFLEQFYDKLGTDYIDVLFLHNCDEESDLDHILNGWMYAYAKELKDAGRIGWIGISSHNTKIALDAVKSGKIEVLMFPVNPLFNMLPQDTADARMKGREVKAMTQAEKDAYPTKQELYDLCGQMGIPIVAMKHFAAGNILKNHEEGRLKGLLELTPVQCISYILSFPQVACPVPGFANVEELNQALAYFNATEEEKDFRVIQESLVGRFQNQCMYCNHCQPCPKKIDIAEVTKLADMAEKEMTDDLQRRYMALARNGADCIHCESCTRRCPFGIDASENMRRAQQVFANGNLSHSAN